MGAVIILTLLMVFIPTVFSSVQKTVKQTEHLQMVSLLADEIMSNHIEKDFDSLVSEKGIKTMYFIRNGNNINVDYRYVFEVELWEADLKSLTVRILWSDRNKPREFILQTLRYRSGQV